jgi:outer membrane protein
MKRSICLVLGLALVMSLGLAAIAHAADDYKKVGVRLRGVFVVPNEDVDNRLSSLEVTLSDTVVPEIDFEYFFLKNVSAELMAAITRHDIRAQGTNVGSTWLLPPTLTVKYHPWGGSTFSPYVGVGVNVTFPYDTHSVLGKTSIDNSVGYVAQAGLDFKINENIFLNLDYKYVNIDTKIEIAGTKFNLDINPNLFGFGIGYRF